MKIKLKFSVDEFGVGRLKQVTENAKMKVNEDGLEFCLDEKGEFILESEEKLLFEIKPLEEKILEFEIK